MDNTIPTAKLTCPQCRSRLTVLETHSGGRVVFVAVLGVSVEETAIAFETFIAPDAGPDIKCPACAGWMDPSGLRAVRR